VDKILRKVDEDDPLTMRTTPDGVVLATPAAYADQLTGQGTLGEQQLFNDALPDVDGATAVVFVDVRRVAEIYGRPVPEEGKAVSAFGLTVSTSGDESGIHMRLVAG
jgi:hypothetical protein